MQNNKSRQPIKKADSLKSGAIHTGKDGKKWEVYKTKSGEYKWKYAKSKSVKCVKYLSNQIKKYIATYKSKKSKKILNPKQAIAIAYSQTKNKFPDCEYIKR